MLVSLIPHGAAAQRPVRLAEALDSALARAPGVAIARADSAAARARLATARAFPNPALALGYTKDIPQRHLEVEQPLEYPWVRSARVHAARAAAAGAAYSLEAERAALRYQVETAYVRAAASTELLRLSQRNTADGGELLRIAQAREAAGDASRLDVALARVTAGQLRTEALADSLAALDAGFELQVLMGIDSDTLRVQPADSLAGLALDVPAGIPTTLRVDAARLELESSRAGLSLARRGRLPVPAVRFGFDQGDPSGEETGLLPTLGVSLPLPLFNRGGGEVAAAAAEAQRARAILADAERDAGAALAAAGRRRDIARTQLERDRAVAEDAEQVARMAATAYREGESPLVNVIEAQRNARDALRRLIEDLAAVRTAEATLAFARTAGGTP